MEGPAELPKALLPKGEMTRFCPLPVPRRSFPCHFKGLDGSATDRQVFEFLPCKSIACADIRVGGDVAEWSKALPC